MLDTDTVYYETMRGDSLTTSYSRFFPNNKVRSLSLGRVCRELRYFLVREVRKVVVYDRFFNFSNERAYRIFEYLIDNDNGVSTFEFNIDGENLDDETIRLLEGAREGLFEFNIDVASTNAEVLAAVGRKENIYQLMYNVTKLLQGGKVKCYIHLTAGLPEETEALFGRSFNKAFGLAQGSPVKIDFLQLSKGTLLRSDADKYGYESTVASPFDVISNDHMPAGDLLRIRQVARVTDAYIGEGGFKDSIPRLLSDTGMRPYDFFGRMTDFIAEKGGGTLTFSVGRYLTGAVYLKSGVNIRLDAASDIIGTDNIYGYKGQKAIFNGIGVENVTIYATRGNGVIDGRADLVMKSYNDQKAKGFITSSTPVPTLLYFENCKNIKLQKFLYRNPATPGMFYEAVNSDVSVEGCFTDTRE
jgi:hypothetical protein